MPGVEPQSSTASDSGKGSRSFAARHGAALAAGAAALTLLAIAAAFMPYRHVEPLPSPPAHWFDDRAKLVSPGYAAGKSEYLQQYLPLILHASVLIVTEPQSSGGRVEDYTSSSGKPI
jgi:hypothetical protein